MFNKVIKQTTIIKLLCVLILIFSLFCEIISLDKLNSLPYCLMGISIACVGFMTAHKIKLFSPIYNFLNCIFFAYIFSGLFYFCQNIDVMGTNTLLHNNLWLEINTVYILFFLSLVFPIFIYLLFIKQKIKINIPFFKANITKKDINLKIFILNLVFLCSIFLVFKYTGMNLYVAFTQSAEFRHLISNGVISIIYILALATFSYVYIIILNDIISGKKNINIVNKILLITMFVIWSLICGSKGVLIFTGIFPLIAMYSFYKQIKVKHLLFVLMGIIFVLFYSAILNIFRVNGLNMIINNDFSAFSKINILKTLANRNDNFANSIKFFKYLDGTENIIYFEDFHYKQELTNHFIKFLPKNIRNHITSSDCDLFTTEMSKFFYPDAILIQKATFEFGAISNLYWCFGIGGTIVFALLFSLFVIFCELLFNKYKYNDLFLNFYFCILYNIIVSFCAVGLINVTPTMKLFYIIPHFIIMTLLFNINLNMNKNKRN